MKLRKLLAGFFDRGGSEPVTAAVETPPSPISDFQNRLGYQFSDPSILLLALTHKSCAAADDRKGIGSNERLEFLGDAVLNCLVTEHLYETHPREAEGHLSKIKSLIVSRKIIGEVGFAVGLDKVIKLSASEKRSARSGANPTIVSNAFEAVIGAVYLDANRNMCPVRKIFDSHLFPCIERFVADDGNVNYKSRILELSQRDGFGIPEYLTLSESGPDHAKHFVVAIEVAGIRLGEGSGSSKKLAQQDAASAAVSQYSMGLIESRRAAIAQPEEKEL